MKKKTPSFRMHSRGKRRKKGDTSELAAQLAPLEEQDKRSAEQQLGRGLNSTNAQAARDYGAIVVDNADLMVPQDIVEEEGQKRFLGIEPVVLVLLILFLGFIAFVAWQITLMPPAQK